MAEEKKGIIQEFKEFISRGSVIDLAVGVVVGGAFTAIVNSLVEDIVMPIIGIIIGGVDFTSLSITVLDATITYGNFIQAVIQFLAISLVVFLIVKAINSAHDQMAAKLKRETEEEAAEEAPAVSDEVRLLTEIRDALLDRE